MKLIIVESPTKSKTISKFLGPGYKVIASFGHIRDLPKSELGVDVENNFEPKYIIPLKARRVVRQLKEEAKDKKEIILASDEDREGEAIAWHIAQVLSPKTPRDYQRIVFHEITKSAIIKALKNPRRINTNLVQAQQARRILDRLVGYKLSPLLWKKVARGLSAGRVQSVALKLICEREKEIEAFKPQEYWTITAVLRKKTNKSQEQNQFEAVLIKEKNKTLSKFALKKGADAEAVIQRLKGAPYQIKSLAKKEVKRNPLPPFTTSTLQQEAWQKFHWSAKFTMRLAQILYERGIITYHRTDSLNLSNESLAKAKEFITKIFGESYYQFRKYKTKSKSAQEAHEAIRPTKPNQTPQEIQAKMKLDHRETSLFELIWKRFIASQMSQAKFDSLTVDIKAKDYIFRASGQTLKFEGFLKVYPLKFEEKKLPPLALKENLELEKLVPGQHFTKPPARYTEASLIKTLEKEEIGRPSTYAPIVSTIQLRGYVQKNQNRKFEPTDLGKVVNHLLENHFPKIVDLKFTANLEKNLDKVAQGKEKWQELIRQFYTPFSNQLKKKYKELSKQKIAEEKTNKKCPKCGAPLIIKLGRYGKFYACTNFPKCRYTAPLEKKTLGIKCPKCKIGDIIEKRTKKGKIFYACSRWPKCDFALWDKPLKETCPKCHSLLVYDQRRKLIKCSNKDCDFSKKATEEEIKKLSNH